MMCMESPGSFLGFVLYHGATVIGVQGCRIQESAWVM